MPVEGPQYPVNLVLRGRSVLVVGGGVVAASKVDGLLAGGADTLTVVAPEVVDAIHAMPVAVEERPYRSPEAADHRLVVAATDDAEVNRRVFLDADAAGVWVNSADDPANCTFTLPARVRRGQLMVTVATGGHSPALAKWLRRRFEAEFGPEYDELMELLSSERERILAEGRSTEGLPWQDALDSGMIDLLRSDRTAEALDLLRTCLSSSSA
ncbi:MAG: bifunctional precorrin-2 dehydrogenase/sirohydrochlorin ferrochelatase [Acidimicrobiales bacterium]|nr:bifunctional precorrin-2 dehydrogenase/sirohydrochlorin ferrochelatase [Acidimicrobiales bacterium]